MISTLELPSPGAARDHPAAFAEFASGGRWKAARHLIWIADRLRDMERGKAPPRLVISCPPRHGKSWLISRYLPAWYLGRHPEQSVALVTFQERFSRKWGRLARDTFLQVAPDLWGLRTLRRASTAEWEVYRGWQRTEGMCQAIGAQGAITGKGAHLLILDDLIKDMAAARNKGLQEQIWEWFLSAIETRLEPPELVVIISTRWDDSDLIGRLMKLQGAGELGDRYTFVNLPAIAEDDDPMGRAPGEALWPEKYPADRLAKKQRNVGSIVWNALYQGHPTPAEGSVFKKAWFKYFEDAGHALIVPERGACRVEDLQRFATIDLAASKKKRGKFTAILSWGYHPTWKALLLLDVIRGRLGPEGILPAMRDARERNKLAILYAEREGPLLAERLGHILKVAKREGLPIVELTPNGDKRSRAIAASPSLEAGQVFFKRGAKWLADLEEELLVFTGDEDAFSDQVDALGYGVSIFQERSSRHGSSEDDEPPRQSWKFEDRRT